MVLVYVDDCIFFGKDAKAIDEVIKCLQQQFELTIKDVQEDAKVDVFSYLGVQVKVKQTGMVTFKQAGLILKVLKYCGMEECNKKWTPASMMPLGMIKMDKDLMQSGSMLLQLGCFSTTGVQPVGPIYNMQSTNVLNSCAPQR